ncbi:hypothetical protein G6N76_09785 [Rhizobium daejeonense]|uniref:Tip attachment protein J domain-containing protein n=1 Tax=Rhizobium daejeonense TaxID=240521 RepID=A0A6M1RQQ1_9HYPH|nr:phage tail protein [Rhizobium daejeonense]NGO63964.1 hypothetical protein [Rhizobium daejeonense]
MLSSAAYAAATMPAHAEPISFAIFSALYTIGIPGAIANAISLVAIPALAIGGSLALGRARAPSIKASDAKSTFESSEAQVMDGIGRVRVGGLQAFGNSDGSTRARLVCRLNGPIDAVEEYYIGGREVTVDPNGDVSSPPWSKNGGSWCNWKDKPGTGGETAWSSLLSLFPDLWTSAHRVRGIAQSLTIWYNPGLSEDKYFTLYQGGIPSTEQVIRASRLYDPRTGLTAWSDNGILACAHVLRRDPAFAFGMFDWSLIASEANKADVLVATKTGTEKRARAWGIWGWETARSDVMQQLLDSIGAELRITNAGKIWFQLIDDTHVPEVEFTPDDGVELTWRSGPEAVERPNICRVTYYSPERNYESAEINLDGIAWASVEDEVSRYGPKYLDIDLPFCPSASQAQRIARRRFAQARGDTGIINTNMVGLSAWGLLYGEITLPDLGDILPVRMEAPRVDDEQGTVEIPFTVWPLLPVWNPSLDEASAPEPIPDLGYETDMISPNAPASAIQVTFPGGAGTELRIGFTLPAQEYDTAEATFRSYTGDLPNSWQGMFEGPSADAATFAYLPGSYGGLTIDARVRVFNGDDGSYYSPILHTVVGVDNTACAAPTLVSGGTSTLGSSAQLNVTVSAGELRAAYVTLESRGPTTGGIGWTPWSLVSQQNARPGQHLTFTDSRSVGTGGGDVEWRLQTLTSNGTGGPYRTLSQNVAPSS